MTESNANERAQRARRALLERRSRNASPSESGRGIPRREDRLRAPISFAQQRLWFLEQIEPGNPAYHLSSVLRLQGPLDVGALERAMQSVVARHEALRTTFVLDGESPIQRVAERVDVTIPIHTLERSAETGFSEDATPWVLDRLRAPFSLEHGPLFRIELLRMREGDHALLIVAHHIISDGWSLGILINELTACYKSEVLGTPIELPDPSVQFGDFSAWQRERLSGEAGENELSFWQSRLGHGDTAELLTDRPRGAAQTFQGDQHTVLIPKETHGAIASAAADAGVTLYMFLLAGLQAMLHRSSGGQTINIGSAVAGRPHPDLATTIGFFANTTVHHADIDPDALFADFLTDTRENAIATHAHEETPFERIVDAIRPTRDPSRNPLFQVLLVLQNAPRGSLDFEGITVSPLDIPRKTAKFDLSISAIELDRGLALQLEYNTDLFDKKTIETLATRYETLLADAARYPNTSIADLAFASEDETRLVVEEWNRTSQDLGPSTTVHEAIYEQVERTPNAIAVAFAENTLTYQELWDRAGGIATALKQHRVVPGDFVGVHTERSLDLVPALLGVMRCGAAYLPLDPSYPEDRLAYMLSDAGAKVVLSQSDIIHELESADINILTLDEDLATVLPDDDGDPKLAPTELAYLIYTSGSSGRPKGVRVAHAGVVNCIRWLQEAYELQANERVLQLTSIGFDISISELFWPLIVGASIRVAAPDAQRDPIEVAETIDADALSTVQFVPSALRSFLDAMPEGACQSVRRVLCIGEGLPMDVVRTCHERLPLAVVHNMYGPTEATVQVTWWPCDITRASHETNVIAPIGTPIANCRCHIVDQRGRVAPIGVPGELVLAGDQLADGYHNRPDLTAQSFLDLQLTDTLTERVYRTGDLARWRSDGVLEFLGRMDGQVKLRGHRIELGEIESVLREMDGIDDAAAVIMEPKPGDQRLAVFLVCENEESASPSIIRRWLRGKVPEPMIPQFIERIEALPSTPNGKVDRKTLASRQVSDAQPTTAYVEPRTEAERAIAAVWAELIGVPQVGLTDNFFDLGGHSLLAVRSIARIEEQTGVRLGIREIMMQNVAQLGAACDRRAAAT